MKSTRMDRMRQFAVLVGFKALAELRTERQRTYLGFLWWFFEPAFFMAVFYSVFAVLLNRGGPDFVAVLLSGLVLWQWFNNSIMHCANSVQSGMGLMRSVPVEASLFPLSTFIADSFKFLAVLVVLFGLIVFMGHPPRLAWLALPFVLLTELVWACGASMLVAALVPFVPDFRFVIAPLLQGMFFLSGIFFTMDSIPPHMRRWLEFDPMAVIIDCGRNILLYGKLPDAWRLGRMFFVGLVVLAIGIWLLRVMTHRYPKLAD